MGSQEATVGRNQELASIEAFLDREPAGLTILLIEGEPGIGKSTLWREAVRGARGRSYRVLESRCDEAETGFGFAALIDILGPIAEEVAPALPEVQRKALDAALLRGSAETEVGTGGAVAVAVTEALRALAHRCRLAVAIDDLHWLDVPSRRALEFAFRRLGAEPITLILTRGPSSAWDALLNRASTERLRVPSLSLGAVYQLVHGRLGVALARPVLNRIHQTSGGNPFFALELARALVERGAELETTAHLPVPEHLGDLLLDRLERLPRRTRRMLVVAAAMGATTVQQLRDVAGSGADGDIEIAEKAGILDSRDGNIRFVHPLMAAAVYDHATGAELREIHHSVAVGLADPEERARHLALACSGPDESVASALDDAARSAARRGATDVAARLAQQALELTPAGDRAQSFRRAMRAATHALTAGDRSRARVLFERSVADASSGQDRAEALRRLAEVSSPLGHGLALCDRALEDTGDHASLASRIHRTRGAIAYFLGDVPAAEHHARLGVQFAEGSEDAETLGEALAELGHWTFCGGGGIDRDVFERAVRLNASAGAQSPRSHLAKVLMDADAIDDARGLLLRLLDEAMENGNLHAASAHQFHLAELEAWAGNWALSIRYAEESLQLRQHIDQPSAPLYVKAMAEACLGHLDEARRDAEAGREEAERAEDVVFRMQNLHALGFIELSLGNHETAQTYLGEATELLRPRWNREFGDCHVMPDEIETLVALGELVRAEDLTAWMEEVGRRTGRAWTLATGSRSRALLQAARSDLDGADAALEQALAAHERLSMPLELARTLLVRGIVQRRSKRRAAAREALEESLRIFEQLGAPLWSKKAQIEIARIGIRTEAQAELTPIEERIAALVAEGRRNREIAAALSLSPKTVEANLSRTFRKLGIRSRAELAAKRAGGGSLGEGPERRDSPDYGGSVRA
jgi:DNA-binding CsgD family transcriptional regulator